MRFASVTASYGKQIRIYENDHLGFIGRLTLSFETWRMTMDRADLLKRLSDRKLEHWESRGLSPVKSRQLVSEKMADWKKLTDEQLRKLLEQAEEPEY